MYATHTTHGHETDLIACQQAFLPTEQKPSLLKTAQHPKGWFGYIYHLTNKPHCRKLVNQLCVFFLAEADLEQHVGTFKALGVEKDSLFGRCAEGHLGGSRCACLSEAFPMTLLLLLH